MVMCGIVHPMANLDEVQRRYVEITLQELPMVTWDRFVAYSRNWVAYGWIDRERDAYKDFVAVEFAFGPTGVDVWFVTSSAAHTDEISERLGIPNDEHGKCQGM